MPLLDFHYSDAIKDNTAMLAQGGVRELGAIFTRVEVVNFILDIAGYTEDQPLHKKRVLEPSFGAGDFILPIIARLLNAWSMAKSNSNPLEELGNAILAVELHKETYKTTHTAVVMLLTNAGIASEIALGLANKWLVQGDYLLTSLVGYFDFVVGNPPYVRQELIPEALLNEYRRRYSTLYDRADLYIPFIEKSLTVLKPQGKLGFICADRWMKNKYGGPLRKLVADKFHLQIYVDMTDTPAFNTNVIAYPAITIFTREKSAMTRIAHRPAIENGELKRLSVALTNKAVETDSLLVRDVAGVVKGSEPWLLESVDQMKLIRRLEQTFPNIEDVGCKIGIGVATGSDQAFIGKFDELNVEADRKVPLVTTKDIVSGEVVWTGLGVINPYADIGGLVDLNTYPKLRGYLESRREIISKRHCAQKSPGNWYRTIDRITPSLALKPKLLLPDIKGEAHVVYEEGKLYPHHNLYYVTSTEWDLRALQAVLLSSVTRLFVATYSTKMRGGFLRFQAQYLRRIRMPKWSEVPISLRSELSNAAVNRNINACNIATFKLYNLNNEEQAALGGNGD